MGCAGAPAPGLGRAPCHNRLLSPPFPSYSRSHDLTAQPVSNGAAEPAKNGPQVSVEKIYVKDVSFEAPGAAAVFNEQAQPQLQMNLNQRVQRLNETAFEVVLGITLTCTIGEDKTAYLAEVQQAGVFGLTGFDDAALDAILGTHCRSEEHTSELQSLMRISYAVLCLKKK